MQKMFEYVDCLILVLASSVSKAAGVHFLPVARSGASLAAARSAVVNPRVVLAGGLPRTATTGCVTSHVGSHAVLRASHLLCTLLPVCFTT